MLDDILWKDFNIISECREVTVFIQDPLHKEATIEVIYNIITELKEKKLINKFHFMFHRNLDLRLYCDNWDEHIDEIYEVLHHNEVYDVLTPYTPTASNTVGIFTDDLLHIISTIMLMYWKLYKEGELTSSIYTKQYAKLYISLIAHFMYNQFGYTNIEEANILFNAAYTQAGVYIDRNPTSTTNYYSTLKAAYSRLHHLLRYYRINNLKDKIKRWFWRTIL